MKKAVLFIAVAFALAVSLQTPAWAESASYSVYLKLNIQDADGTVQQSDGTTYTVDENDIINYSSNYNITVNNTVYNCSYLTFSLAGIHNNGGSAVGRYDVTMYLDFVGSFVASDPVLGGEFYLGLLIPGYLERYNYDLDQFYFTGEGSGSTGFDTEYLGYSSIGCKLFKCTIRPASNGNNTPLSKFRRIAVKFHWSGNPGAGELSFVFGNSSHLVCMTSDDADLDYVNDQNEIMEEQVEVVEDRADNISSDLSISTPDDVDNISSDLLSNLEYNDALQFFSPNGTPLFMSYLSTVGVVSLSVALLGYIFFGKKG